jgi:hypothetical protein
MCPVAAIEGDPSIVGGSFDKARFREMWFQTVGFTALEEKRLRFRPSRGPRLAV